MHKIHCSTNQITFEIHFLQKLLRCNFSFLFSYGSFIKSLKDGPHFILGFFNMVSVYAETMLNWRVGLSAITRLRGF